MENKTFSHYTIIRKLGSGGMASVYLAEDNELPRQVALKLLPNQFIADKQLTERFFREARAAAKLEHPNIILIYEASIYQGQPFIAMQYIEGPTVAELISAKGKIEIEEAVSIICKVLETLEAAHKKGIFHRDIKPTNVMLKDGKYVRVIDFGIAKAATDSNLTAAGTAFGTPAYMAPEQFSASPDANSALYDVYAVGVTFYYMLCGKLPFEGDNPYTIRDLKIYKKPSNPSAMASNIPPALDEVVMKAMAANPKDRYQSAQEMFEAIHNALKASQTAIIDIREDPDALKQTSRTKKPKPKWPIGVAAGLVLLGATYFTPWPCKLLRINCGEPTQPVKLNSPTLLLPPNGSTITYTDKPEFVWSSTAGNGGSYVLEYSANENFSQAVRNANLEDTTYNPPTALANGTYFWRVRGKTKEGLEGEFSNSASFELSIRIEGTINVIVNFPSKILVDGNTMRTNATNWEGQADAGQHTVRVENPTTVERVLERVIFVEKDQRVPVPFNFTIVTPSQNSQVRVASRPTSLQIFVDGNLVPDIKTPNTLSLNAGLHKISLRNEDGTEKSKGVNLQGGMNYRLYIDFIADTNSFTELQ